MSDLDRYTSWKVPKRWGEIIGQWRERHREELEIRGMDNNSGAVLYILSKVMEAEGIIDPLDVRLWEGVRTKAMVP